MSKTIKYVLYPDFIRSKNDGQEHFITAGMLASLYRVPMSECLVCPFDAYQELTWRLGRNLEGLKHLAPKYHGNYARP